MEQQMSHEKRAELFHERYGEDFDPGDTLVNLVAACGSYLETIVGKERADAGMAEIVRDVTDNDHRSAHWREALSENASHAFSEWPLGAELHDLTAYAVYGVALTDSTDIGDRQAFLNEVIQKAEAFFSASPFELWGFEKGEWSQLGRVLRMARNRWALDHDRPLEPGGLADLGGITEASVRNMMSGEKRTFTNQDGKVPAAEARTWLETREAFWSSIWQEESKPELQPATSAPLDEPVFVPVSRDGSVFNPGLSGKAGYTIGHKGAERKLTDFETALRALQEMPTPYWRRPNEKGIPGIVRGMRWVRLDRRFLDSLVDKPSYRLPQNFAD